MQVTPEVETQFKVGDNNIYVVEVEEDTYQFPGSGGRTRIVGHDDEGNEVEVVMYTVSAEKFKEEMGFAHDEV